VDAGDFPGYVAGAPADRLGPAFGERDDLPPGDVPQRADLRHHNRDPANGLLAFLAPAVIGRGSQRVARHRVRHHHAHLRGIERNMPHAERAAIDEQRMIAPAETRSELVHDAAAHSHELVFGVLAGAGERRAIERSAGKSGKREGG
jgi:hypothetical protein